MLIVVFAVAASTLRLATPLILSALGGVFSERSGVVNIALEGIMIMGALFSIYAFSVFDPIFGMLIASVLGILAAIIAGVITSLLLGVMAVTLKSNQVVTGVAINLLATSFAAFFLRLIWKRAGQSPRFRTGATNFQDSSLLNTLEPYLGETITSFFKGLNPFVYIAIVAVILSYYVLYKTPFGLRVRAVGEHPKAADTVGINVSKIRYICILISGALAGLSGAALSLGSVGIFREGMTAGKGFIALAAMIFGKWHPVGAFLACIFFGFTEAIQMQARTLGLDFIPGEFLTALPYIATILALAGFIGKAAAPAAGGIPYEKGDKH